MVDTKSVEYYKDMCIQLASENLKLRQELEKHKGKTPIIEFLDDWLSIIKNKVKPTTYSGYEIQIKKHFKPYFKGYFLETTTSSDIEKYFAFKLDQGLSAQTVRSHRSTSRAAFSYAYKHDLIDENIIKKTDSIKPEKFEYQILSFNEISRLLIITRDMNDYPAILLSALLGLRRSEALGLKWSDVDFEKKIASINSTCLRVYNSNEHTYETILLKSTKNKTSSRQIPLSDFMISELKHIKSKQQDRAKSPRYKREYMDYVCLGKNGALLNPQNVSRHFKKILADNGFDTNVRFHDLRHSCATYLHNELGFDIKDISVYLGHSNIQTTGNIYMHESVNTNIATSINNKLKNCYENNLDNSLAVS